MIKEKRFAKIIEVGDYADYKDLPKDAFIITATQNLKNSDLFKESADVLSFSDVIFLAKKNIDRKTTITNVELKYLINNAINKLFSEKKGQTYKNCIESLVELYNKLIISCTESFDLQNAKLGEQYSFVEQDIFALYVEVVNGLKVNHYKTYNESVVEEISKMLNCYENIAFVGFVFLNDIQESTIRMLQAKTLYFINKKSNFITDELFKPLLLKIGREISIQDVETKRSSDFRKLEENIFTNKKVDVSLDDKIDVYEPFTNREDEFLFIAKDISDKLRFLNLTSKEYESKLKEFAIVITKNKEELVKILNDAFGQYGLFIPNIENYEGIKPVYFSKQEFIDSKLTKNNVNVDYIDKIKLFNKFRRIDVTGLSYRSVDYPIGKFVVEVYKIITEGLTLDRFKNLINTNWYLNDIADAKSLKDISLLNIYFENLTVLDEWYNQIERLIELKDEIDIQVNYSKHPLFVVSKNSLEYMKAYISFLQCIVSKLKFNGSIRQQIQNIIETFGLIDIKAPTKQEQEMLESFVSILKSIDAGDSLNVDYVYFADHIEELFLNYYELIQQGNNNLKISVVNMENYTKYNYVYFPMFEDNKYPRILKEKFPYTNSIISILNQFGIELPKNQQMKYHLKMSRHIFKNIFSFTENKLTFTYVNFENGMDVGVSTYAYDIFKTAGKDLIFKKRDILQNVSLGNRDIKFFDLKVNKIYLNELFYRDLCAKMFYHNVKYNNLISYSTDFLLHFYAKALLFNKFFINLSSLNKEYSISDREFDSDVEKVFQTSFNEIMNFFHFFNESVKRDIKITTKKQVIDFIDLRIKHGKFAAKYFRFELGKEKEIIVSETIVRVRQTMILVNLSNKKRTEFDISKGLDFLVSSCGGQKYDFVHYDEIMNKLMKCSRFDDKMALVNFASFKVNTQINNDKYREDGIKRVESLVFSANESVSSFGDSVSSFCRFCPLNNMCKEVLVDDK